MSSRVAAMLSALCSVALILVSLFFRYLCDAQKIEKEFPSCFSQPPQQSAGSNPVCFSLFSPSSPVLGCNTLERTWCQSVLQPLGPQVCNWVQVGQFHIPPATCLKMELGRAHGLPFMFTFLWEDCRGIGNPPPLPQKVAPKITLLLIRQVVSKLAMVPGATQKSVQALKQCTSNAPLAILELYLVSIG